MGTHYKGTRREVTALDTFIKLVRAADSFTSLSSRLAAEAGLTLSQFGVLEALYHLGPLCQRNLGQKILRSSGNITMVVDNLEKRGLVKRERDSTDRRFITVHLTEKGADLIREIFPRHVREIVDAMSILSLEEQEQLGRLCRRVGKRGKE
jgi:MarR family 2-MHQ and catechol resistance regulon transcriptional repressor